MKTNIDTNPSLHFYNFFECFTTLFYNFPFKVFSFVLFFFSFTRYKPISVNFTSFKMIEFNWIGKSIESSSLCQFVCQNQIKAQPEYFYLHNKFYSFIIRYSRWTNWKSFQKFRVKPIVTNINWSAHSSSVIVFWKF